jgi:hypothetical protein
MSQATTEARRERNRMIKREVQAELALGLRLKEALYVVAERYWLSKSQVERIYYETRIV